MNLIDTAKAYAHSGLSVIPTTADKRPAVSWKAFTTRLPSEREIDVNFVRAEGIGIVCGKVSGNLELLDFDDKGSQFEPWFAKVPPYLKGRLVVETSPSGGKHVYYRIKDYSGLPGGQPLPPNDASVGGDHRAPRIVEGNRKLAMKADGHVLIETRGEGGYVKCAPSSGYTLVQGDFQHVPTISPFEEKVLIDYAVALDQRGDLATKNTESTKEVVSVSSVNFVASLSPFDDYNERGDIVELLTKYGWHKTGGPSDNEHWERPEKNEKSTSATWNGTVFYVFSSNAAPFEMGKGYNKAQVYAILEHGGDMSRAAHALRNMGYGLVDARASGTLAPTVPNDGVVGADYQAARGALGDRPLPSNDGVVEASPDYPDPGPLPPELLSCPGFVDQLAAHTLSIAPYPNRTLAFVGALTMLAHLTGRNFRNERNLRTNLYAVALAASGVGKDVIRKVNMSLATELGIMPTMADRFASAEGLEDALLLHPASFFQVDEIDTLFASLQEKKDSSNERIYGSLLQFATSADTTYSMRKKAIQQAGGKGGKFDKIRAQGIREPHLTLLGTAIPKYLYSALSERSLENGLLSRCLLIEAGPRGKAGTPHAEPFSTEILETAHYFAGLGGFDGVDLDNLDAPQEPYREPYIVLETDEARAAHTDMMLECEALYDAGKSTAEQALWTRGGEKADRLALLYALSENPYEPLITPKAVDWAWRLVKHLTARMLFQANEYVHDSEFDALRQKSIRFLRAAPSRSMIHGDLLRKLHIDADSFRRVIETLVESNLVVATPLQKGGNRYTLI